MFSFCLTLDSSGRWFAGNHLRFENEPGDSLNNHPGLLSWIGNAARHLLSKSRISGWEFFLVGTPRHDRTEIPSVFMIIPSEFSEGSPWKGHVTCVMLHPFLLNCTCLPTVALLGGQFKRGRAPPNRRFLCKWGVCLRAFWGFLFIC